MNELIKRTKFILEKQGHANLRDLLVLIFLDFQICVKRLARKVASILIAPINNLRFET